VYVVLSFARVEVPEGEVEELADGTWLVMADKPVVFAVGLWAQWRFWLATTR